MLHSARTGATALTAQPGRWASPAVLAYLSVALLVLDWALFVRPGASYAAVAPNDFLLFADMSHRLASGQVPHVDFHAPKGWLSMWLPRVGFLLQGGFAGAPEAADMLMLAVLLPLACIVLAGRAPTGAAIAVLAAVFGMTAAPWWIGSSGSATDPGLHYNHWGWSLMTILLLVGLPGESSRRWLADGAVVGALLSLMFFVKASHWLVGMGFVLLFGLALGEFRRAAVLGLSLFAACVLAVQAAGGWIDDYVRDVLAAVRIAQEPLSSEGGHRPVSIMGVLHGARADAALAALVAAAAALWGCLSRRTALHGLFTLAACVALMTQNSHAPNLMGALAAFFVRLAAEAPAGSGTRRLSLAGLALHLAPAFARQAAATAAFVAAMTVSAENWLPASLPRMEGVWFGQESARSVNVTDERASWRSLDDAFVWGRSHRGRIGNSHLSSAEYRASLQSGVDLLRASGAEQGRVATFDFQSPFPALLNAPPPAGILVCLHINRHLARSNAGDADLMLGDAQWLMIPRLPYMQDTKALLLEALAEHLEAEWRFAASNELWTLMRRREAP